MQINTLDFKPLLGFSSKHLQMIFSSYAPLGTSLPSSRELIDLGQGDFLACEVSVPLDWKEKDSTVVLVHGMGGSHLSNYMVRIAKKNYAKGKRVVRINLRGCGSGSGLSKLPYTAGTSFDVRKVLEFLKAKTPYSEMTIVGFSLGGNLILKLAGELKGEAKLLVKKFIAICPPIDLAETVKKIEQKGNRIYHFYYLKGIYKQAKSWAPIKKFRSLYEFDDKVTAPLWGYKGADQYYENCSSLRFLPDIRQSTRILFAKDDPFIAIDKLSEIFLPPLVKVWVCEKGSHMGFIGRAFKEKSIYYMDEMILKWIDEE